MDIKRLDIKEFREKGFLQEANRLFFHPLGLALEIEIDDVTGIERLSSVWDYRDDPEGMLFGDNVIKQSKIDYVEELKESKRIIRTKLIGDIIQNN